MRVLIAEDDRDMQKILRLYLQKDGFEVHVVSNGKEAMDFLTEQGADLVIMDWMMPVQDGIQTCREIRSLRIPTKILMLTAKGQNEDEIQGLTCGADDYLRKPFDIQILLLRVRKLCRAENAMAFRDICLNPETMEVTKGGEKLGLTKTEYELLKYFLSNQRRILSRELLLDRIWGMDYEGDSRTVDTAVRRLRVKIGEDLIQTRIGLGYVMGEGV
ncbi:DNA-binding response regulator [Lachnoclostridium sp. An14]|mgnify:FL=1|uniref:response regulator transcription factor n=1 Tax=Lachnoclostridium sp. An14 TaxID=1965562 RepID=UPI000B3722BC|nr:response regulator transcription factor [Lachnoclostridium sp. An14]OUQ21299.1 DNA-binding response regulator [Lachnoclostridium sp. An14]